MINKNYGKLINIFPQYLRMPVLLTEDMEINGVVHPAGSWLSTDDEAAILQLGYKPIVCSEKPVKEGYYYTEKWTETDAAIVQEWEEHEQPVIEDDSALEEQLNSAYQEGVNEA